MKLTVVPIVRELDLGEYDAHYEGRTVHVWVSAPPDFLRRRDVLLVQYSQQWQELQRMQLRAVRDGGGRLTTVVTLPWKQSAAKKVREGAQAAADRLNAWTAEHFLPGLHAWFAELFSQDLDPETHWTAEELDEILQRDNHLLEFMKRRAMEMILAYAEEKKRASAPPSTA